MKLSLSTLILIFTVVALAIGWTVDRVVRETNLEAEADLIWHQELYSSRIRANYYLGMNYFDYPPAHLDEYMKTTMIESILDLWRHEDYYNGSEFGREWYDSENLANQMLDMLDCDSSLKFRRLATSLYQYQLETERQHRDVLYSGPADPPTQTEQYPEFHSPESENYISLDEFIKRALTSK